MQVSNDVRTTESYQSSTVNSSSKTTALLFPASQNASTPEEDKKFKRQNELTSLANKYNLTYKQLADFISNATGISEDRLLEGDDIQFELIFNKTLPALLKLVENKKLSGNIEEKLTKIASKFRTSIENGNTIEEATNFVENFGNHTFFDILKNKYPDKLRNCASLKDVPRDILKECVQGMIEQSQKQFQEKGKAGFGKSLAIFKNLLDRTSDEDKQILWDVYKEVAGSEEKVQALAATINKTENKEKLQAFLRKFTPSDIKALGLNSQDVAKVSHLLNSNLDEKGVKELQQLQFKFADEINARVRELKSKKPEEYTEEDKQALATLDYVKQSFAGMVTGYKANKNLSAEAQTEYSTNVLDKSKEVNIYEDVLTNIVVLTNDKTGIVNMTDEEKENFSSFINELTNNDYSKAVETYNKEVENYNPGSDAASITGIGLNNQLLNIEQKIQEIAEKKQELKNNSDEKTPKFEVEKTPKKYEIKTVAEAKQFAGSFTKVLENFKQYGDQVMEDAAKTVARFGRSTQVYYANLCSNMKFTNAIEKNNNGWTMEQIQHLNLSFTQRKEMTEKVEKEEQKIK